MADMGLEMIAAPAVNGERESHPAESPVTVLAKEDALSGRLQIRSSGSVLGTFSGQIECEGDLLIGPDAHVEADIRAARVTIAGYVRGNVVAPVSKKVAGSDAPASKPTGGDVPAGTLPVVGSMSKSALRHNYMRAPCLPALPQSGSFGRKPVRPAPCCVSRAVLTRK